MKIAFLRALLASCALASASLAIAEEREAARLDRFAPYAFLIGEWEVHEAASPPVAITRVDWNPSGSSIRLATDLLIKGQRVPHYEGILVWNGIRGDFDMLLDLDPAQAQVQERGRLRIRDDGVIVREIVATYAPGAAGPDGKRVGPDGAEFVFQQLFRPVAPGEIETSMLRKTGDGWVPTFPGSESIMMTRRKQPRIAPTQSAADQAFR